MADDVQLTDLEVIQRYSLAVRGATASRDELVAALQADLDWLRGGRRPSAATSAPGPAPAAPERPAPAKAAPVKAAPAKAGPVKAAPVKPGPAKAAPAKTAVRASSRAAVKRPAKRTGSA